MPCTPAEQKAQLGLPRSRSIGSHLKVLQGGIAKNKMDLLMVLVLLCVFLALVCLYVT